MNKQKYVSLERNATVTEKISEGNHNMTLVLAHLAKPVSRKQKTVLESLNLPKVKKISKRKQSLA